MSKVFSRARYWVEPAETPSEGFSPSRLKPVSPFGFRSKDACLLHWAKERVLLAQSVGQGQFCVDIGVHFELVANEGEMLDQFGETYLKSGEGSRKGKQREGGRTREMTWSRRCARSQAVPPEGETYDRCVTWMCRWSEGVPRDSKRTGVAD